MTDRDEFAAAALTGLLSDIPRYQLGPLTEQAFEIADEMLRQRDAEGRTPQQPALTRGEVFAIRYCLTRTLEKHLVGHSRPEERDVCVQGVVLKQTLLDLIDRFPCKPKD